MGLNMRAVRRLSFKNSIDQSPESRYSAKIAKGGESVDGIPSDRISKVAVEEEVMRWNTKDASHIHRWFVKNVQGDKDDRGEYQVPPSKLEELLEVCEKVLNASQIVWEPAFKARGWKPIRQRMQTHGVAPKVMKNISVAHRLLPSVGGSSDYSTDYSETYIKEVERTREWAERMLMDEERGLKGDIYYSSSW